MKTIGCPWRPSFPGIPFLLVIFAATGMFLACLSSGTVRKTGYTPGIYDGTGRGYRGPVHVQVQISEAGIEDIVIIDHSESSFPGAAAMEELLEAVLETGTTDLDAVSGATYSSRGFLDAVEDAMGQAHGQVHGKAHGQPHS